MEMIKLNNNENLIGNSKQMTDFLGNTYAYNCLGCEIGNKNIIPPGGVIYEDDIFLLASDPEVPLNGFLIVNVKKHINSISELNINEQHRMIELISKSITILKKLNICQEVTIIQEERSKHLHIWIFPNQEWMVHRFGKGVSFVRDICKYAQETVTIDKTKEILETIEKIKKYFND